MFFIWKLSWPFYHLWSYNILLIWHLIYVKVSYIPILILFISVSLELSRCSRNFHWTKLFNLNREYSDLSRIYLQNYLSFFQIGDWMVKFLLRLRDNSVHIFTQSQASYFYIVFELKWNSQFRFASNAYFNKHSFSDYNLL